MVPKPMNKWDDLGGPPLFLETPTYHGSGFVSLHVHRTDDPEKIQGEKKKIRENDVKHPVQIVFSCFFLNSTP